MLPKYKIEIWHSGALLYTITSDALEIHIKETVTENVGNFSFILPTKKNGSNYYYNDVVVGDTAKIWLGYNSISGNPVTVGKISKISAPLSTQQGYVRVFAGMNQGEILKRRQKTKYWEGVGASTTVMELANDLGLVTKIGTADSGDTTHTVDNERMEAEDYWNGQYIQYITGPNRGLNRLITDYHAGTSTIDHNAFPTAVATGHEYLILPTINIDEDTTQVTLQSVDEFYWNMLQKISDYWYDAGTQIKKDFYVDIDNNLVWKSRPLRTEGVETLTVGENITSYNVVRDLQSVRNRFKIYGIQDRPWSGSYGRDGWSDSTSGWGGSGSISTNADRPQTGLGSYSIQVQEEGPSSVINMYKTWTSFSAIYPYEKRWLKFWLKVVVSTGHPRWIDVWLYAPNSSNAFRLYNVPLIDSDRWQEFKFQIGPGSDFELTPMGSPDWGQIGGIFIANNASAQSEPHTMRVDLLHFIDRYQYTVNDATSQSNYGIREMAMTDDRLLSDSDCQKRGESLCYQMKNPPIRLDVATVGNPNILVGDRLSMTIPAEDISEQNYDVVTVEHNFSMLTGFQTRMIMINSADRRIVPPVTPNEILKEQFKNQRDILGWIIIK